MAKLTIKPKLRLPGKIRIWGELIELFATPIGGEIVRRLTQLAGKDEYAMTVGVKLLTPSAHLPHQAYQNDAGWNLYTSEDFTLNPFTRALIPTGVALEIPAGYFGWVTERSSTSFKYFPGLWIRPGIIDAGYRGEIFVRAENESDEPLVIPKHTKIAQLIFLPVVHATFHLKDTLEPSDRGELGVGSSGQ